MASYFFYINGVLLLSSCFFIGVLSMRFQNYLRFDTTLFSTSTESIFVAEVKKKGKSSSKYTRYIANVNAVNELAFSGLILLNIPNDTLKVGDILVFNGQSRPFQEVLNSGQFDYKRYNYYQGIDQQVFVTHYKKVDHKYTFYTAVAEWRSALLKHIATTENLTEDTKALVSALLLGDKAAIAEETRETFKELGIMHILAISGLHIGILYLFLELVYRPLPARVKLVCILLSLWIFVFLSGFSPSVFRAVFMFSTISLVKGLRRNTSTLYIVSLCLFFSLLFNPLWLFDVGFQLSYAAVIGIVLFMPLFKNYYSRFKIVRYFQGIVYVSLVAQLSVLPLQLYYFNQFSILFLASNILVIPLITLFLLAGISWILLSFFDFFITDLFGWFLNLVSNSILGITSYLSGLSESKIIVISLSSLQAFFLLGCILWLYYYSKKRTIQRAFVLVLLGLIFQFTFVVQDYCLNATQEIILPYSYKEDFSVLLRLGSDVKRFGNVKDIESSILADYVKTVRAKSQAYLEGQFAYFVGESTFMILSAEADFYSISLDRQVTHLVFTDDVRLNYDRVLDYVQPAEVIVHNSVPFWIRNLIVASCEKKNIPFHDIREKGYWSYPFL